MVRAVRSVEVGFGVAVVMKAVKSVEEVICDIGVGRPGLRLPGVTVARGYGCPGLRFPLATVVRDGDGVRSRRWMPEVSLYPRTLYTGTYLCTDVSLGHYGGVDKNSCRGLRYLSHCR